MATYFGYLPGAHVPLLSAMSDIGYQFISPGADGEQHAVPLFHLPDHAATRARPLQHLEFAAMLFPILIDGTPLIARVNLRRENYVFGGLSHGTHPRWLHQSLAFAIQQVGHHKRVYETAFITSMSLQVLLLVLRPSSGRTFFLTLQNRAWSEPSEFRLESGLGRFLALAYVKKHPQKFSGADNRMSI